MEKGGQIGTACSLAAQLRRSVRDSFPIADFFTSIVGLALESYSLTIYDGRQATGMAEAKFRRGLNLGKASKRSGMTLELVFPPRRIMRSEARRASELTRIDLFCGAGGITEGFDRRAINACTQTTVCPKQSILPDAWDRLGSLIDDRIPFLGGSVGLQAHGYLGLFGAFRLGPYSMHPV